MLGLHSRSVAGRNASLNKWIIGGGKGQRVNQSHYVRRVIRELLPVRCLNKCNYWRSQSWLPWPDLTPEHWWENNTMTHVSNARCQREGKSSHQWSNDTYLRRIWTCNSEKQGRWTEIHYTKLLEGPGSDALSRLSLLPLLTWQQ